MRFFKLFIVVTLVLTLFSLNFSSVYAVSKTATPQKAVVVNNSGSSKDKVEVTGINSGYFVRIYTSANLSGKPKAELKAGSSKKVIFSLSSNILKKAGGYLYITAQAPGKTVSNPLKVAYRAETKSSNNTKAKYYSYWPDVPDFGALYNIKPDYNTQVDFVYSLEDVSGYSDKYVNYLKKLGFKKQGIYENQAGYFVTYISPKNSVVSLQIVNGNMLLLSLSITGIH